LHGYFSKAANYHYFHEWAKLYVQSHSYMFVLLIYTYQSSTEYNQCYYTLLSFWNCNSRYEWVWVKPVSITWMLSYSSIDGSRLWLCSDGGLFLIIERFWDGGVDFGIMIGLVCFYLCSLIVICIIMLEIKLELSLVFLFLVEIIDFNFFVVFLFMHFY
jgi:hypothetical protein